MQLAQTRPDLIFFLRNAGAKLLQLLKAEVAQHPIANQVAQAQVVTEDDCGTKRGIPKRALYKGEEVDVPLREIILGLK